MFLGGVFGTLLSTGYGFVMLVAGREIQPPSHCADCGECCPVRPCFGLSVCDYDRFHLFFGVTVVVVSPRSRLLTAIGRMLTLGVAMLLLLF